MDVSHSSPRNLVSAIAAELDIPVRQVQATANLLAEGATVPFISRYRKEATGSLDEVAVMAIRDRLQQLEDLQKRRQAIMKSLQDREILTDELAGRIAGAQTMAVLEDIYLPFRPKRRTRALMAREKGLVNAVTFNHRFYPLVQESRAMIPVVVQL